MGAYLRHFQVKIVLLGGERSGKSSLLYRYIYHDFRDTPPSTFDTAFAAKKVEVDGQPCALALWDTAGSRQFSHLSKLFCRGADAVLVCFDITSRQNWERVKVWVHEARTRQPGCHVYLVATKMDLVQPQPEGTESSESHLASLDSASASPSSSVPDLQQQGAQRQGPGAAGSPALQLAPEPAAEQEAAEQEAAVGGGDSSGITCCEGGGRRRDSASLQQPGRQSTALAATPAASTSPAAAAAGAGAVAALSVRPGTSSCGFSERPGGKLVLAGVARAGGVPAAACEDEWEAATRNSSRRQLHFEELLPQHREQQQAEGGGMLGAIMRAKVPAVPDPEIDLFASSVGAHVFRTSAKTGEGVADLFQAVAQECCPLRRQQSSGCASPAKQQQQQQSRAPAQHWGWWGQQGAADVKSGPSTPTTPLQESAAPLPSSFSPARYSIDSCGGEGSGDESGRRPGITHSKEWRRQLCSGGGSHRQQQQQQAVQQQGPGEYVLGPSAFQAPVQRNFEGCYFQGAGYDDELPPSMPEIDYNARGSCTIM